MEEHLDLRHHAAFCSWLFAEQGVSLAVIIQEHRAPPVCRYVQHPLTCQVKLLSFIVSAFFCQVLAELHPLVLESHGITTDLAQHCALRLNQGSPWHWGCCLVTTYVSQPLPRLSNLREWFFQLTSCSSSTAETSGFLWDTTFPSWALVNGSFLPLSAAESTSTTAWRACPR